MLNVSRTPLYIRVDCPNNFPSSKPNIVVLARVVHDNVHPTSKAVNVSQLQHWNLQSGSNILSVVREIHTKFNASPPIPEKHK